VPVARVRVVAAVVMVEEGREEVMVTEVAMVASTDATEVEAMGVRTVSRVEAKVEAMAAAAMVAAARVEVERQEVMMTEVATLAARQVMDAMVVKNQAAQTTPENKAAAEATPFPLMKQEKQPRPAKKG
jgi:hypothetical protein